MVLCSDDVNEKPRRSRCARCLFRGVLFFSTTTTHNTTRYFFYFILLGRDGITIPIRSLKYHVYGISTLYEKYDFVLLFLDGWTGRPTVQLLVS